MSLIILGAIAMSSLVAGLFFLRFWKETRDRFFLFFATSFWVEGINRVLLGLSGGMDEEAPLIYLVRFFSYALILIAVVDKNRADKKR